MAPRDSARDDGGSRPTPSRRVPTTRRESSRHSILGTGPFPSGPGSATRDAVMSQGNDPSRHLLFGLLALQTGLIDQTALVVAFPAWTRDKTRPLADHLIALGHLDPPHRPLLEGLAGAHLARHGGSVEQSLAAIPAGRSTR